MVLDRYGDRVHNRVCVSINISMRNQYKILAEKYEQEVVKQDDTVSESPMKPGTPKVTPYTHADGTTAYKSLTKWGKRQDWRTSAAAHKAAGIPEPKSEPKQEVKETSPRDVEFMNDNDFEYNGTPYEVQAKFVWNGDRAVDTEWLQVMDIDGNVATDPKLLQAAKAFALDMASADPDRYTQYHQNEDTDPYGSRNAPPITVPPEQTRSIKILLNMGFEFSSWIKTGYEDDPETKTAVLTRIRGYRRSVVEVTPDGRGNGQLVAETEQVREIMEPVDDKPYAEDTDSFGPVVPPEQEQSINRLFDMGYEFSQWIKTGQMPPDQQTKTAVMVRKNRSAYSVVEVTPDGLCNGEPLGGTKQVREIMEPWDDRSNDSEDRVADGMKAKLDMTDRSHDSILEAIRAYWLELEAEWKQYHPTQPMPEDVKEELWNSVFKGMEQANVDPTDVFG
jgi:hypothetical protein